MSYESNPIWSIGKKLQVIKDKTVVPGPGMYNPDENIKNAIKPRITNCPMSKAQRLRSVERPEIKKNSNGGGFAEKKVQRGGFMNILKKYLHLF